MTPLLIRFRVGDLLLALPLEVVAGVAEPGPLSPLPGAPPAVAGVATVGGSIVAVFDLEPLLDPPALAAGPALPRHALLVLDRAAAGLALRVAAPPACTPAGSREAAPPTGAAPLCSHGDRAEGLLSGVLDPTRLLRALRRPAPGA